ncbi:MAG: CapA family protein [Clostridiales bacterium]|nr:CapA family protein [Clostridiales bacterium]
MGKKQLTLLFGGDISVGEDSSKYFQSVNTILDNADVRIAQLEEPYVSEVTDFAGINRTTQVLAPMVGKMDILTLAGNHFYDFGDRGVKDTIDWCNSNGIVCCGGGMNLEEAEKPGFFEKDGVKFGVLAYNAQGPKTSFADVDKAGTSYVNFVRAYIPLNQIDQKRTRLENDVWELKKPVHLDEDFMAYNFIDEESYKRVAEQIAETKKQCDILLVYFHKGYVHKTVTLAPYESLLSRMAIDCGADAVMASHSHVLHGIEMYKGKAIYHGLNNFVMWVPQLSPNFKGKVFDTKDSHNEEWIKKRVERFGFVPDPDYPTYPFHPESVYCIVAKLIIEDKKIVSYRYIPMLVEKDGIPYVHGNNEKGREVFDYVERITREANLNAQFKWEGDEVVIY